MLQRLKKKCGWEAYIMIIEILKRSLIGIAFGALYTFIALTIMKFNHIEGSVAEVWNHMLASFVLGIYFGLSSFIYEKDQWSPLKATLIHFFLSIAIYFFIAIPMGWIPLDFKFIILGVVLIIVIYGLYWTGYYLYFKRVEVSMNEHFQKKE